MSKPPPTPAPLKGPGSRNFRIFLMLVASFYLLSMWANGAGVPFASRVTPRWFEYYTQISRLFPRANTSSRDFFLEGWDCNTGRFVALDRARFFPMHAGNKENRFHRIAHFHSKDAPVLHALDAFVVDRHNAAPDPLDVTLGGIRIREARRAIPPLGTTVERYAMPDLDALPSEQRRLVYTTPKSKRAERCGKAPPREGEDA
jgi:hypothetical protein